jgi:hypothetical protein
MPRPTRPDRLENPIRLLRFVLTEPGKVTLSQTLLSPITDVPLDTLKAVESGRIEKLSDRILHRIRIQIGAAWNKEDKRWRFWTPDGPLYTREHYQQYRDFLLSQQILHLDNDAFFIFYRIKLLLENSIRRDQFTLFFELNSFLEEARKRFCPDKFAEFFRDASGYVEAIPEISREIRGFVIRKYPEQLMRHFDQETLGDWFKADLFDFDAYQKELKQQQKKGTEEKGAVKSRKQSPA